MSAAAQSPAYVRECLDYDQGTGVFTWKRRPREHFKGLRAYVAWNTRFPGKTAGSITHFGRAVIALSGASHLCHRLAWVLSYGEWPHGPIDHIDGNPLNNAIGNLRRCTPSQNQMNHTVLAGKRSGLPKGVTPAHGKFKAQIRLEGKQTNLGLFETPEAAHRAYCEAALKRDSSFANFGEFVPTADVPLVEIARHAHKFLTVVAPNEPATIQLGEALRAMP